MLSRIARNFIRLNLCLLLALFLIGLNVLLVVSNYLACKISFELLGTENRPLGTDELVGTFFRAFFSQASLAHLYAMLVAVTVTIGLFLVLKLAFDIIKIVEDQSVYRERGDQRSAQIASRRIVHNLVMIGIFAIPLGFAIQWDIHLFRLRSIAQAMGYEYPEMVVKMLNWGEQLREKADFWVWSITKIGAWGYLAVTAICCLSLEYTLYRTGESWALLIDALSELFGQGPQEEAEAQSYLPIPNIQPAPGLNIPAAVQNVAGAGPDNGSIKAGNPPGNGQMAANVPLQPVIPVMAPGVAGGGDGIAATQFAGGNTGHTNHPGEVLFEPVAEAPVPGQMVSPQPPLRRENEAVLRPVHGSPTGERVSLAEALLHPESYWVDLDTHEIWDANYRRTLMG